MSNELIVGIKIGAALAGTFQAAFASARGTLGQLGQTVDRLKDRQDRLGRAMAQALAHPARNVGALRAQYERLGATIDRVAARQAALAASIARGEALKQQRAELRGSIMETAGTAVALGAPVVQSVRLAASHQDRMRDVAITGDFSAREEAQVGRAVRESALRWNQTQAEVAKGVAVLVAGGIQSAKELAAYAPSMSKIATATRASMDDLGSVAIALNDSLKISSDGFEGAMNMLAYAGKRGQFEIRDMAKWVPSLAPSFQSLGVTGKEAVAEIGAALQIARKGAGTNDEAANNFRNFLAKITAPDTIKDFSKAGIDLKQSMLNLRAQGMSPVQAMLGTITAYMGSKGPAAAGELTKALKIKDDKEREAALQRLTEAYKLGELFQDMQAMNFIRPAIANAGEMKSIMSGANDAADKGVIDDDYRKRVETATEQYKAFKVGLADVGITIGDALLPPLVELLHEVRPVVSAFGAWAKENPGLVKSVIGLVGGLLLGKLAVLGVAYGFKLLLSPLTAAKTAFQAVSARWSLLQAAWQGGRFAPLINGLKSIGSGAASVGRALLPWFKTLGSGILTAARAAALFGRGLAMTFIGPVKLAGQVVLWLGRALLMNPIGLAITAIAVGAYLIYRYWAPIKAFFLGLWAQVRTAFAGGIGGIARLILDWSPLGLFYRAFAGVMKYFGIEMPKTFSGFGGMLIDGLVNGVKAKLTSARDAIVSFGGSIKGWFTSTLGIQSPSRVFMGFGDNIAQGAAIGITRTAPLAARAVTGMAVAAAAAGAHAAPVKLSAGQAQAQQVLAARANAGAGRAGAEQPGTAAGSGLIVHFSPNITVQGGPAAKGELTDALRLSLPELERLIERVMAQQQRRSN